MTKQEIDYIKNCAKMIPYPIDLKDKTINVNKCDLDQAKENITVTHLIARFDFHIQSCINGSLQYGKVFNPAITERKIIKERSEFELNDMFRIKSTGCELKISYIKTGKIHFIYVNRNKPGFINSEEHLNKMLKMEVWERI